MPFEDYELETPLDEQVFIPPEKKEKEKTNRFDRKYVEETIKIKTSDFGKGILIPQEEPQPNQPLIGKKDKFTACTLAHSLDVRYTADLNSIYTTLDISYDYGDGSSFARSQTLRLVMYELTFGVGWSFVCNMCNKPCKTLFLPSGDSFFACRSCKDLHYGKCYLKPHIEYHKPLYGINRFNKVISNWPIQKRFFYKKKPTRKVVRIFEMHLKEGASPASEKLQKLLTLYVMSKTQANIQ